MSIAKKALVTGGERGIGKGIVLCLAEAGYDIATTYLFDEEEAASIEKEVKALGRRSFVYQASLEKTEVVESLVKKVTADLGGLDLLVNNAGMKAPRNMIYNTTTEEIDMIFSVNFRAYMILMREASRYMMKHGTPGNIINISSLSAGRSFPIFSLYGGLKAAVDRATKDIALELAPYGIRVNSILPGAIIVRNYEESIRDNISAEDIEDRDKLAKKIPLQRLGTPLDIGKAVVWMTSEDASYITGVNLCVDGGLRLPGMPEKRPRSDDTDFGWSFMKYLGEEDMKDW